MKNHKQQGLDSSQAPQKGGVFKRVIEFFSRLNEFKDKPQRQQSGYPPLQKIHLQVNTDLNKLDQVLQWFNQLEHLSIPKKVLWQCQLAVAEGFTNAVRHAHKHLPMETPIELEVNVFQESLEIKIGDYGQPFDLDAKLSEIREVEEDPLERESGNGLRILQQIAERVSYIRTPDNRNYLVIVKHLMPSSTV